MKIIPAIDIKNGKCVRLFQGEKNRETIFFEEPLDAAKKWQDEGAEIIHIIDLDGAFEGNLKNLESIKKILKNIKISIHVGGGIRNLDTIKTLLDLGVKRVILGTQAISNPDLIFQASEKFPNQIILGIDARNGFVAIQGWTETTKIKAIDLANSFKHCKIFAINYTDIYRDGTQKGPNILETKIFAQAISEYMPVVASGGVSNIQDIKNLLELSQFGVIGIIIGKALYAKTLNLKDAIKLANNLLMPI